MILAALVTVYIVLGVLYESYIHPMTILSTLPSAGVGALLALMFCRTDFSVIALIGIILLIGIVKKNAIMMIDFALDAERTRESRRSKRSIKPACCVSADHDDDHGGAVGRACRWRLAHGTGSELRRPLGITIIGGLIFSQLLTLYTTPVIYLAFDRLAARLGPGTRAPTLRVAAAGRGGRMSISAPFIQSAGGDDAADIAVALAGGLAYFFLPVSPLPQVDFPTIQVSAKLPGASPETWPLRWPRRWSASSAASPASPK